MKFAIFAIAVSFVSIFIKKLVDGSSRNKSFFGQSPLKLSRANINKYSSRMAWAGSRELNIGRRIISASQIPPMCMTHDNTIKITFVISNIKFKHD